MKRTAHIVTGPGFIDDSALNARIRGLGFELVKSEYVPRKLFEFKAPLGAEDVIFARGPWSVDPENFLYARIIASSLRGVKTKVASVSGGEEKAPKLIATGRAALAALLAGWAHENVIATLAHGWQRFANDPRGPWQKFSSEVDPSKKFYSLIEAQSCPDLSGTGASSFLRFHDSQTWAWKYPNQIYSFVDPLAFFDGSQLDNFGYGSLEGLLFNTDFIEHALETL
ncbi:hypothetical protein GW916_14700 [bacterium]|nr:hypothetical protein [bacterium]